MGRIAALLCACLAAWAQAAAPAERSVVGGRVLNAVTGEPVAKAALLLQPEAGPGPADWAGSFAATTDAAGRFSIPGIPLGRYRLRATRNGYVALAYGARGASREGRVLDLDPSRQMAELVLRMAPQGVISGRVMDGDGEPVLGAKVQLLRRRYVNGKRVMAAAEVAFTNDLGEFRWAGLAAGTYYLSAESLFGMPPSSAEKEAFVPVYYPNTVQPEGAAAIDLAAGGSFRAGDIVLPKAATVTVSGRVVVELPEATGVPAVRLYREAGHAGATMGSYRVSSAKVGAGGAFVAANLIPGVYMVTAEIAKGRRGYAGWTKVEVGGADVEGVVVKIQGEVAMAGRVRVEGEGKPDLEKVTVRLQSGGPETEFASWEGPYRVARDGVFRIDGVGRRRYGVRVDGLPESYHVKSVRAGEADVLTAGMDAAAGAPGELDVVLSPAAGIITGVARGGQEGATVVLLPKEADRQRIAVFYLRATTDARGRFVFPNVIPGEYTVYGWEDVEESAWLDPEFVAAVAPKGVPVKVRPGARLELPLELIPGEGEAKSP